MAEIKHTHLDDSQITVWIWLSPDEIEDVRTAKDEEGFTEKMLLDYILRLCLGKRRR